MTAAPVRTHDVLPARRLDRSAEREADAVARGGSRRARLGERRTPLAGGGRPLAPDLRALAEPRLGIDLSSVRVHDDARAHAAAAERNARAVTAGDDILFAEGEHRPGTPAGRELLLHELAHVAQQRERGQQVAQHQPEPRRTDGIGRTPPDEYYAVATLPLTQGEDAHVLFPHDKIELDAAAVAERARKVFRDHSGAVVVSVHGYASAEGDAEYNVNLSAHRAVAVRNAIASVLPAGSVVNLIAHGSTDAFGGPAQNRRVGLDVWDMPAQSDITLDAERFLRRRPWVLGGTLRLDLDAPAPAPQPGGPQKTPAEVAQGATPGTRVPRRGIRGPYGGWIDWEPGDPNWMTAPGSIRFDPLPIGDVADRIPWGQLNEDFQTRGLVLGEGDQTLLIRHWQRWHPFARAVYPLLDIKFPIFGKPFDSPDDLMLTVTRKVISNALSGDRPNMFEEMDKELAKRGLPTPIPIFSKEWRF